MKFVVVLALVISIMACAKQVANEEEQLLKLSEITRIWQTAKEMHPAWHKLYPVCLIDDGNYKLYHPDGADNWTKVDEGKFGMRLPDGVKAAFPLPFGDHDMACILDVNCFHTKEDMAIVFHEFVHCYQSATCEHDIKATLRVAQENKHTNGMWELEYAFPYDNELAGKTYIQMIEAAENKDRDEVIRLREMIRKNVTEQDWEYLCWQEFKEGTARFLQNELSKRLDAKPALSNRSLPINRVSFYEGGEMIIRLIMLDDEGIEKDFPRLWTRISNL